MKYAKVVAFCACVALVHLPAYAHPPLDTFDVLVGNWTCVGEDRADPQNPHEILGTWEVTQQADGQIRAVYTQQQTAANPYPITEVEFIGKNAHNRHYHTESISLVGGPTIVSAFTVESNHGNHDNYDTVIWKGRNWGALGTPFESPQDLQETWTISTAKNATVIHAEVEIKNSEGQFVLIAIDDGIKSRAKQ